MSSAADRLRDKARRTRDAAQARTGTEVTAVASTPPVGAEEPFVTAAQADAVPSESRRPVGTSGRRAVAPAVRTAPVRITVDLSPVDHRNLKQWCDGAADQLGRASVAGADVVRVLLDRLHSDPVLARDVVAGLAQRIR